MSLALLTALALGAEIELLLADTFPTPMNGTDGWSGGYAEDAWTGLGAEAHPLTDDSGDAGVVVYGTGDGNDNWMVNTGIGVVAEGGITAELDGDDDDTIGLVHSLAGDSLYLVAWCLDVCPLGVTGGAGRFYILRVENGVPTEIARRAYVAGGDRFGVHVVDVVREDDPLGGGHRIAVTVDGALLLEAVDPTPLPAGHSGFYAFNNGTCPAQQCETDFDDLRIWAIDEDDDGVADDHDNCEALANADQADADGDGEGDLCDASPETTPPEGDADTDADSDADADADTDADSDADSDGDTDADGDTSAPVDGEVLIVGSGCDGTGGLGRGAAGIGLLLAASRRRARR